MKDVIKPSGRIDAEGNFRAVDNAYEEGIYAAVIGLELTENPYQPNDQLNRKLWLKGFSGVKSGSIRAAGITVKGEGDGH